MLNDIRYRAPSGPRPQRSIYSGLSGRVLAVAALLLCCLPPAATAQEQPAEKTPRLRVFLDGDYMRIGSDFIRTEIDFVDWVRDPSDADVHIIVTSQSAGGGGTAYTVDFLGRGSFEDREDSLVYTSGQGDTPDENRTGVVRAMKLGLAPFLLRTSEGASFDLSYSAGQPEAGRQVPVVDPWDYWVFRTSLGGNISGETSRRDRSVNGSFSARRITEDLKLELSVTGNYSENDITLSSGMRHDFTHTLGYDGQVVFSLGQHWAVGVRNSADSSTRLNQHLSARLSPILEYSFFPYREFTRRRLTLQYSIGLNYFDYENETLFNLISETRYDESLRLSLDVTQPWGDASFSLEAAHYFFDVNKFHVNANSRCDIRLFRGFSFNINGNYGRIHDQLYLKAGGYTDEEILLRLRRLQTAYDYEIRIGFSFTFGSIFNSIVNPRLQTNQRGGPGGGGRG